MGDLHHRLPVTKNQLFMKWHKTKENLYGKVEFTKVMMQKQVVRDTRLEYGISFVNYIQE